jgi:arsenate reductase
MKIYTYKNCSTCRKAVKWLEAKGLDFEELPIRETPPSKTELKVMLGHYGGDMRRLFNTSGGDYRELGLKDTLPGMSETEAFELLSNRGNLVKRPFLIAKDFGLVGFKEAEWEEKF